MPSATKTFRFCEPEQRVFDYLFKAEQATHLHKATEIGALLGVMADGLQLRMMDHAKPVHRHFIDTLTPEGRFDLFLKFLAAVDRDVGLPGADGRPPEYRFEQVPAGGLWETLGVVGGYGVLRDGESFTANGVEVRGIGHMRAGERA